MHFTHEDQIEYAKVALRLHDQESDNAKSIEQLLAVGELIKKHSAEENAVIYDVTEYLYEQLRTIRGDVEAYDTSELRKQIEETIR